MILCFFACMTCANKGKRKEEKRELKRISTSPLPRLSLLYRRLPRSLVWDTQPAEKSLVFSALFKRKTSENSSPVALVRAPRPLRASVAPPHQKKRVKWRLFCLLNSKLILIFGQRSPSYSYGRSPPGHFVYFVQKDLGGRSLCFSHAEFNIEIEVYKLKVQCGISDQIWLSRTVLTHVFMSCVSPVSRWSIKDYIFSKLFQWSNNWYLDMDFNLKVCGL